MDSFIEIPIKLYEAQPAGLEDIDIDQEMWEEKATININHIELIYPYQDDETKIYLSSGSNILCSMPYDKFMENFHSINISIDND